MREYIAKDDWSIKTINGKLFFCYTDPGHGGREFKIEVTEVEYNYAVNKNPDLNCMYEFVAHQGLV